MKGSHSAGRTPSARRHPSVCPSRMLPKLGEFPSSFFPSVLEERSGSTGPASRFGLHRCPRCVDLLGAGLEAGLVYGEAEPVAADQLVVGGASLQVLRDDVD